MVSFPQLRLRRLRRSEILRNLVRETEVRIGNLIYPLFIEEGRHIKREIDAMPGIYRFSPDALAEEIKEVTRLGIPGILLFGIPAHKDENGSSAIDPEGIIPQAIKTIKDIAPELLVITDVCLCEYTSHGHCGIIRNDCVDNDQTLPLLAEMALAHAEAGADMVAPSDMMDGRVMVIREALDDKGFTEIPIMSYAAKYASAFYGPFREAAGSTPQFGDRRSPAHTSEHPLIHGL